MKEAHAPSRSKYLSDRGYAWAMSRHLNGGDKCFFDVFVVRLPPYHPAARKWADVVRRGQLRLAL